LLDTILSVLWPACLAVEGLLAICVLRNLRSHLFFNLYILADFTIWGTVWIASLWWPDMINTNEYCRRVFSVIEWPILLMMAFAAIEATAIPARAWLAVMAYFGAAAIVTLATLRDARFPGLMHPILIAKLWISLNYLMFLLLTFRVSLWHGRIMGMLMLWNACSSLAVVLWHSHDTRPASCILIGGSMACYGAWAFRIHWNRHGNLQLSGHP